MLEFIFRINFWQWKYWVKGDEHLEKKKKEYEHLNYPPKSLPKCLCQLTHPLVIHLFLKVTAVVHADV